jgi:spoIIIJ-associated protein
MVEFLETLLAKMGCDGKVTIGIREENKIMMMINSLHSGILIGRRGATLDALQLVANVYAGKIGEDDTKIILDAEGYRKRREDSLVRLAKKTADQVRKTRTSKLLDFMNPYERRLIHTSLSSYEDVDTISEGEGLYKQVRVIFKGSH